MNKSRVDIAAQKAVALFINSQNNSHYEVQRITQLDWTGYRLLRRAVWMGGVAGRA